MKTRSLKHRQPFPSLSLSTPPFRRVLWVVFLLAGFAGRARNHRSQEAFDAHHSLGTMLSHTRVFQGVQADGEKKWLALPSIGLSYNYKFHPAWAIGLHNDIIIEDFEGEQHLRSGGSAGNEILQRSYPLARSIPPLGIRTLITNTCLDCGPTFNTPFMQISLFWQKSRLCPLSIGQKPKK